MDNKKDSKIRKIPARAVYLALGGIIKAGAKMLFGVRIKEDGKARSLMRSGCGMMVLSAHPSEIDAVVLLCACYPFRTRFVVGSQQLYRGIQGRTLKLMGAIPKKQFTADVSAVKEMIKTVKNGEILAMMPEGRVSADGTLGPVDISTAKLIKKLGCPVAVLVPKGTYFVKPPFDRRKIFKGRIGGDLSLLFAEGEAARFSEWEILEKLCEALNYNCFEEQKALNAVYGRANDPVMRNSDRMLCRCPGCGSLYSFSKDEGGALRCVVCGASVRTGKGMFFERCGSGSGPKTFESIAEWNSFQLEDERKFFEGRDAFIEFKVIEKSMRLRAETEFSDAGGGVIRLDASGFSYEGDGGSLAVPAASLTGVSADYTDGFIAMYDGDCIRRFYFEDIRMTIRFVDAIRAIREISDRRENGR